MLRKSKNQILSVPAGRRLCCGTTLGGSSAKGHGAGRVVARRACQIHGARSCRGERSLECSTAWSGSTMHPGCAAGDVVSRRCWFSPHARSPQLLPGLPEGRSSERTSGSPNATPVRAPALPTARLPSRSGKPGANPGGSFALVVMLQTGNMGIVGQPTPVRAVLRVDKNPPIECRQPRYCVFPSTQALAVLRQLKVGSLILIDVFTEKGAFNFSLTPKGYQAGMAQIRAWGYRTE
jgi:hypothetical protein